MGLFGFLKKEKAALLLGAPAKGTVVPMEAIPDEVFSTGVLGPCCGVDPIEGAVYAPADGTISQLADTLHAVGLEAAGADVLLHIGVDTVEMGGDGFTAAVQAGQQVKKGDLLVTVDLEKVRAAGHPAVVIMAVTNGDSFASVETIAGGQVQPGGDLLRIVR